MTGFRGSHWERRLLGKTLKEEATRISEHKPKAFTKVNKGQGRGELNEPEE